MEHINDVPVSVGKMMEVFGSIGIGTVIAITFMLTVAWMNDKKHTKDLNAAFKLIREMRTDITEILLEVREMRTKLDLQE